MGTYNTTLNFGTGSAPGLDETKTTRFVRGRHEGQKGNITYVDSTIKGNAPSEPIQYTSPISPESLDALAVSYAAQHTLDAAPEPKRQKDVQLGEVPVRDSVPTEHIDAKVREYCRSLNIASVEPRGKTSPAKGSLSRTYDGLGFYEIPKSKTAETENDEPDTGIEALDFFVKAVLDGDDYVCLEEGERHRQIAEKSPGAVPELYATEKIRMDNGTVMTLLVMRMENGTTLDEHLKNNYSKSAPVPMLDAMEIVKGILEKTRGVHDAGYTHGDLKPANVMVDREGKVTRILDLGSTSMIGDVRGNTSASPHYMAPERVRKSLGRSDSPSHPTEDIYTAGAILYRMITGQRPCEDVVSEKYRQKSKNEISQKDFMTELMESLEKAHENDHYRTILSPEDQKRIGMLDDVNTILNRSLDKDPSRRYQSCDEMIAALDTVIQMHRRVQQRMVNNILEKTLRYGIPYNNA